MWRSCCKCRMRVCASSSAKSKKPFRQTIGRLCRWFVFWGGMKIRKRSTEAFSEARGMSKFRQGLRRGSGNILHKKSTRHGLFRVGRSFQRMAFIVLPVRFERCGYTLPRETLYAYRCRNSRSFEEHGLYSNHRSLSECYFPTPSPILYIYGLS